DARLRLACLDQPVVHGATAAPVVELPPERLLVERDSAVGILGGDVEVNWTRHGLSLPGSQDSGAGEGTDLAFSVSETWVVPASATTAARGRRSGPPFTAKR